MDKKNKWREIVIGNFTSTDQMVKVLTEKNIEITPFASRILEKMPLEATPKKISVVEITPSELGFTARPQREEIYDRAERMGFRLVPPEVGPELLLIDPTFPNYAVLVGMYIAMQPIADDRGNNATFSLEGTDHVEYDTDGRPTVFMGKPKLFAGTGLGIGYDIASIWIFLRK